MATTNNVKKFTKLELSIFVLATLQITSYLFFIYVNYETGHDNNPSDFDWMGEIFPVSMFIFFGLINIILFSTYVFTCIRKKVIPRRPIIAYIIMLVILYVFMSDVADYFYYLNR